MANLMGNMVINNGHLGYPIFRQRQVEVQDQLMTSNNHFAKFDSSAGETTCCWRPTDTYRMRLNATSLGLLSMPILDLFDDFDIC